MPLYAPANYPRPIYGAHELVVPHDSLFLPQTPGGWTTWVGAMPVRATAGGVGARGSTSNYVSKPTSILGKPWTIIGSYQFNAALTGSWLAGVCESPGASSFDRQIGRSGSNLAAMIFDGATKTATVSIGGAVTAEKLYNVVATCDGANLRIACNGVAGTPVAVSNFGFAGYTTPEFCVGNSANAGNALSTDHSVMLVALLPYADINYVALSENPWQIFKPRTARIYSFPTAATASKVPVIMAHLRQQGVA
jgi:hypothetical protein